MNDINVFTEPEFLISVVVSVVLTLPTSTFRLSRLGFRAVKTSRKKLAGEADRQADLVLKSRTRPRVPDSSAFQNDVARKLSSRTLWYDPPPAPTSDPVTGTEPPSLSRSKRETRAHCNEHAARGMVTASPTPGGLVVESRVHRRAHMKNTHRRSRRDSARRRSRRLTPAGRTYFFSRETKRRRTAQDTRPPLPACRAPTSDCRAFVPSGGIRAQTAQNDRPNSKTTC